ncbi:MAG: SDR family oxidoreductase [Planctomycetota bacterium]
MTRVAVTAASGKLGAGIVRASCEIVGNENVVGLARTPSKAASLGVEVRPGDYSRPDDLTKSLRDVESVLLVSGMDAPEKRITQHRNVIDAAKSAGVKRIVYTSIQGSEQKTAFSPVVQSNRQTEADVRASGLEWSIGRNGIYIEPDIEYLETYKDAGEVANCAGDGRCGYTTRGELGFAYAKMLTGTEHIEQTYNLHGDSLTQQQLVDHFNTTFGLDLNYRTMTVAEYRQDRIAELGEFMGGIISGIYEGIRLGECDNESHFEQAAGRPHVSWDDYFATIEKAD